MPLLFVFVIPMKDDIQYQPGLLHGSQKVINEQQDYLSINKVDV